MIPDHIKKKLKWTPYVYARYDFLPGNVLKIKDGNIYLVGDVNRILGICDDYTWTVPDFEKKDILEIANLWEVL